MKKKNVKQIKNTEIPKLGKTLQRLRQAYSLSLSDLSESSGVSKSIISQIEKNESNPTLSTMWRLSNALDTDMGDFLQIDSSQPLISITPPHEIPTLKSEDGLCSIRILSTLNTVNWLQWYEFIAEKDGILESSPHQKGSMEHLHIHQGEVEVTVNNQKLSGSKGSILRYQSDFEHSIRNTGNEQVIAEMLLVLKHFIPKEDGG